MTDSNTDFLKKSVTAQDLGEVMKGGVMRLIIPWAAYGYDQIQLPPKPPAFWTPQRDAVLRSTIYHEPMWAGAVGVGITKMASLAFEITSKVPKRQKEAQQLLLGADGTSYIQFIAKGLRDFLTTDNGMFVELVRAKESLSSKIIGLRHLDSARCTRTGDIETPVLYRDRAGRIHELQDYQVLMFADMPDPAESYFGVGMCAASRAYIAIYKLAAIEWYIAEKVAGLHPLAIHIVNGVLDAQLKGAVDTAREEQVSRGIAAYMGAVIVGVPQQTAPSLVTIPLAELPNRFDRKEEFDLAVLSYANDLGLDIQDLQPLSGQSLGTGAQSNVLADKAQGKGLIIWRQEWTHLFNEYILDDLTEFAFIERDYRDRKQAADLQKTHAETAKARIEAQITTAEQEMVIMVQEDEIPAEFLPQATSAAVTPLSDTDKPDEADANIASEVTADAPVATPTPEGEPPKPGEAASPSQPAAQPATDGKKPPSERAARLADRMRNTRQRKTHAPRLADAMKKRKKPDAAAISQAIKARLHTKEAATMPLYRVESHSKAFSGGNGHNIPSNGKILTQGIVSDIAHEKDVKLPTSAGRLAEAALAVDNELEAAKAIVAGLIHE